MVKEGDIGANPKEQNFVLSQVWGEHDIKEVNQKKRFSEPQNGKPEVKVCMAS